MNRLFAYLIPLTLMCPEFVLARSGESDLIATTANVNVLLIIAAQLLVLALGVLGLGFILISISKYKKHKKMPTFVPLQTVVMMFLGGVLMLGLCVIYVYTGEDILGSDYMSILSSTSEQL